MSEQQESQKWDPGFPKDGGKGPGLNQGRTGVEVGPGLNGPVDGVGCEESTAHSALNRVRGVKGCLWVMAHVRT